MAPMQLSPASNTKSESSFWVQLIVPTGPDQVKIARKLHCLQAGVKKVYRHRDLNDSNPITHDIINSRASQDALRE